MGVVHDLDEYRRRKQAAKDVHPASQEQPTGDWKRDLLAMRKEDRKWDDHED